MHANTRQALRVDAFGLREMVLGKSRQAHQRTIMHSNTRQAKSRQAHQRTIMHSNTRQALNASTRSVYAKWYWVNHGRLTSERKAYLPLPIVTHQSLDPAARALKRQASCLYPSSSITRPCCSSAQVDSSAKLLVFLRVDAFATRRRGNHMHDHSRFQRDID